MTNGGHYCPSSNTSKSIFWNIYRIFLSFQLVAIDHFPKVVIRIALLPPTLLFWQTHLQEVGLNGPLPQIPVKFQPYFHLFKKILLVNLNIAQPKVIFPMSIKHVTDIEAGLIFTSIWNEQKEMLSQKQSFYARFYSNRDCISPSMLSYYHFVLNDWIILLCILFAVLTVHYINEIQILD